MKNIDFLNELNGLAQNRLQSKPTAKLIDLGIFNVEGKNVGVAIYERTRTGSIYEIYAFVEQNEHLVESGHVTLGLVENLYDDEKTLFIMEQNLIVLFCIGKPMI